MKYLKIALLSLTLCVGIVFWLAEDGGERQADTFCAYDRVFVEITKGNRVWGTILLDDSGAPVKCKGDEAIEQKPSSMKGLI